MKHQLLTQQMVDVIRLPFPAQTERFHEDRLSFKRAKRPRVVRLQLAAREPRGHVEAGGRVVGIWNDGPPSLDSDHPPSSRRMPPPPDDRARHDAPRVDRIA